MGEQKEEQKEQQQEKIAELIQETVEEQKEQDNTPLDIIPGNNSEPIVVVENPITDNESPVGEDQSIPRQLSYSQSFISGNNQYLDTHLHHHSYTQSSDMPY